MFWVSQKVLHCHSSLSVLVNWGRSTTHLMMHWWTIVDDFTKYAVIVCADVLWTMNKETSQVEWKVCHQPALMDIFIYAGRSDLEHAFNKIFCSKNWSILWFCRLKIDKTFQTMPCRCWNWRSYHISEKLLYCSIVEIDWYHFLTVSSKNIFPAKSQWNDSSANGKNVWNMEFTKNVQCCSFLCQYRLAP